MGKRNGGRWSWCSKESGKDKKGIAAKMAAVPFEQKFDIFVHIIKTEFDIVGQILPIFDMLCSGKPMANPLPIKLTRQESKGRKEHCNDA